MKNLVIALSLVSSLIVASSAMAEGASNFESKIEAKEVETLVVVSKPEVANFEIYSLELAGEAMESVMDVVSETLSAPLSSVSNSLNEVAVSLTSSI